MSKKLFYKINEYTSLKLENGNINMYVENEFFRKCNFISLHLPKKHFDTSNILEKKVKQSNQSILACEINLSLSQEEEFHEYCNRFRAWSEHKYDSRILPLYFVFPLMRKLVELKDSRARNTFKEEIVKKIVIGSNYDLYFLIFNNYLSFLNPEETELCYHEYVKRNGIPGDLLLLYEFGRRGVINAYECLEKVLRHKLRDKFPFFNENLIPTEKLQVKLIRQIIFDLFLYQSLQFAKKLFKDRRKLIENKL